MGVNTEKFIRKPLYVDAVRVTEENFDEIVAWCQGEVLTDEAAEGTTGKPYIKVRVHNPKFPRQTQAYVGDWLLYTERGYKVYTNKAFRASFDSVVPNPERNGVEATLEREPIEMVSATPQAIADVANEQQPVVSDSVTAPPPQTEDGRRILTAMEQREMDPEEVTNLLRSGEAVLQQDLV